MIAPLAASSITLGSPGWTNFVLVAGVLFFLLLLGSAVRSPLPAKWKWGLFALKGTAIGLLTICLLDPLITRSRATPGENIVVLLADQSASMGMRQSAGSTSTRGEWAKELLDPNQEWQTRLGQDFDVRRYAFGTSLKSVDGFHDLAFEGTGSNLFAAISGLHRRFSRQPLGAILLLTDGNSTDSVPPDLEKLGVPIFPVIATSNEPLTDISIQNVSVSQTNFEDAPVTVTGTVAFSGKRPERIVATVEMVGSEKDSTHQSQTITVGSQDPLPFRFQLKPLRPGALFYRLKVRNEAEPEVFERPETSREATLINNQRTVAVNRDPHTSRILYVGGRPNWEHKFLNRALSSDPQLQLVSLIRIARKEARFDFRGRDGETSNSIFRGFKSAADEETEDYSQPVLIRLNTLDQQELSDGFPLEKAKLYKYDAIILDDVEAGFFTHDQQGLIDRFVAERGGGLLMLGGIDTFRNGKWNGTPVADALPVYLNRKEDGPSEERNWQLSREGMLEPWLRLRETEEAERTRLRDASPFSTWTVVSQMKPGARLLAEMNRPGSDQKSPAVVVQQYGYGRTGAMLVGDLWKWSMKAKGPEDEDAAKSWRQVARWLVADVPRRVTLTTGRSEAEGKLATEILVRVRDREFLPDSGQRVTIKVRQPDGTDVSVEAQPGLDETGLFISRYFSHQAGTYLAEVTVSLGEDEPPQVKTIGWTSDPAAEEFSTASVNQALLGEIAKKTGGELIPEDRLTEFATRFPERDLPVMETESTPLWHRPGMMMLVIALLAGEWGIRRWRGLT